MTIRAKAGLDSKQIESNPKVEKSVPSPEKPDLNKK